MPMTKHILRQMAWERAKGELESIKTTFIGEEVQYSNYSLELDKFIKKVEGDGLQE